MAEELSFGRFFKELRIRQQKTLRRFCQENGFDPGNTSKLECDELPAPQAQERLEEYALALGLERGSEEWRKFFDLAAISAGRIPSDVLSDSELVARLPLVFRTLRNKKLEGEQIDDFIDFLRRN